MKVKMIGFFGSDLYNLWIGWYVYIWYFVFGFVFMFFLLFDWG